MPRRVMSQAGRLIRALLPCAALFFCALTVSALAPGDAQGSPGSQAMIVVQFDPESYVARCIPLPDESVTGLDLLARAGLDTATWGSAVCSIGGVGCDYPVERCFCQCLSAPCSFWSYWQWSDGRWVYSQVGASQRKVSDGDIDAWVWGDGHTAPSLQSVRGFCTATAATVTAQQESPVSPAAGAPDRILPLGVTPSTLASHYAFFGLFAVLLVATGSWLGHRRRSRQPARLHTLTWLVWLSAGAHLALTNQQPLSSILVILAAGVVFGTVSGGQPGSVGWRSLLRMGLWLWLVALAFNVLSVHAGKLVILHFPPSWPIIGGPITFEAFLFGLASGASLFAILLVFATFNLAAEIHRLLRWVPAGLYQAGLVVSIAFGFVPQLLASHEEIRQAQRVRGHRSRGLRDWIPLIGPLLTTALERSLTVAESMEARGFGGIIPRDVPTHRACSYAAAGIGLLAILTGLLMRALSIGSAQLALAAIALGVGLALTGIYARSRGIVRTHYPQEPWRWQDSLVTLACAASIALAACARARDLWSLAYYPYPPHSPWPTHSVPVGLAAVLLVTPALVSERQATPRRPKANAGQTC